MTECLICGAQVINIDRHAKWHSETSRQVNVFRYSPGVSVEWATPFDQMQALLKVYRFWQERGISGETNYILESVWEYCRGLRPVPLGTVEKWSAEWDEQHAKLELYEIRASDNTYFYVEAKSISSAMLRGIDFIHRQFRQPEGITIIGIWKVNGE